jgi:hypothetical protein
MADEPRFTPEQVRLVMKSAGLDPSRSVDEQLRDDTADLQKRINELEEQLAEATKEQTPEPQSLHAAQVAQGERMLRSMKASGIGPYGWATGDEDGSEAA